MKKNKVTTFIGVICLFLLLCTCCVFWIMYSGGIEYVVPVPYTYERLKTLNNVDKIEIYVYFPPDYEPVYRRIITDPEEINVIVEKMHTYADNWILPTFHYFSFPQSPVQVAFARNGETKLLVGFGIGYRYGFPYMAVQPGGKYLTESEFKELMTVLGIDENCARLSSVNPKCNTDGFEEYHFIPPEGY